MMASEVSSTEGYQPDLSCVTGCIRQR